MSDNNFPECEKFTGRLKAICRCETELPLDGPQSHNAYRRLWGLDPIINDSPKPAPQPAKASASGIMAMRGLGDLLASGIKFATFGMVKPCGGCGKRQEKLNNMFPNPLLSKDVVETTAVQSGNSEMKWAYGVTTVIERLHNGLLQTTLESLKRGGFDKPRLFIDGDNRGFERFGLEMTHRAQVIRSYGNWLLGLLELYIRDPFADRYAMFQDDFVTYVGLRGYLEQVQYPEKGYWNLYTFPHNQPDQLANRVMNGTKTHPTLDPNTVGFYPACQNGKGAVALIFDNTAVKFLLSRPHMIERVQNSQRGHKAIDGGVVEAFRQEGWTEYVHNPSLVQHIGEQSSMGNPQHLKSISFRGEQFDARTLLSQTVT
jgi:hypothetical protein